MPPFTGFGVFYLFMMAAKLSYKLKDQVPAEE
jgi:hypothetical protein